MNPHSPTTVACLGPEGSFSHEFAQSRFPAATAIPINGGFEDVLSSLEQGASDAAVIPFLNSNGIHVRPAQASIAAAKSWVRITGCFPHRVVHNLVVVPEQFKNLQRVVSKEEVFPQCTTWLDCWEGMELISASSTSAALKELLASPPKVQETTGVICNRLAVELYGGAIRYEGIENPGNVTLFLVASRDQPEPESDQALVCLTCPTEVCYQTTIREFAAAGLPLKFTSLRGEFTPELPCFLQFAVDGRGATLSRLLENPHRHHIGDFPERNSLAACVAGLFDDTE